MRVHRLASLTAAAVFVLTLSPELGARQPTHTRRPAAIIYDSPAADSGAGPIGVGDPFARILPSGRILHPTGTSVVTGMNALGFALSPDGRFAIVSNDDERQAMTVSRLDPKTLGGFSLAVIDTATMEVVDRYRAAKESFFAGVLALPDPAHPETTLVLASGGPSNVVYALDLDANGHLTADPVHAIAMPVPNDPAYADRGHAFPGTLVAAPDGTRAFAINEGSGTVATIDLASRRVVGDPISVGFFPYGGAIAGDRLFVANEGLMRYGVAPATTVAPPFTSPTRDLARASSISIVPTAATAANPAPVSVSAIPLDRNLDGVTQVGGVHPVAIAAMRRRPYAFVALANVDRVATIAVAGDASHVVGGTELRFYDRGPYGTQPSALALSTDERRLYVALAGIDAIAVLDVRDPLRPHRLGLIPTGWAPSDLHFSRDGRYLFVTNAKGLGTDANFAGDRAVATDAKGHVTAVEADGNAIWSTFERIDLKHIDLAKITPTALSYLRAVHPAERNAVVPQRFSTLRKGPITHVVFILEENKTYDAMLGDLKDSTGIPYGPGDPSAVSFDESVTPNLHELARSYALAGNFYADAEESDAAHQFAAGGIATSYTERTLLLKSGRRPLVNKNEDPEDYPRSGYIFNSLASRGMSFRDYGDFVRVAGYDEGGAADPKVDDPTFAGIADTDAPTQGLGGRYSLDVPALAALAGHLDQNYPGWNLRIRDERRAKEFVRDFDALVKANAMPTFTYIWLPADHGGFGSDVPPLPEEVADGDRALGTIVDYLTHLPQFASTAIFITPDDAQSSRDHIDEHRTYAIVVSPYAKRHFIDRRHLSTVSIVKTEEELLGLPPLSLGDALASDMRDMFTPTEDTTPFLKLPVATQTASREGTRIAALLGRTDQSAADADPIRSARIIDLARRADRLAAEHARPDDGSYRRKQEMLYAHALAVVAGP